MTERVSTPRSGPGSRSGWLVFALLVSCAPAPRVPPVETVTRAPPAETCAGCHVREAEEWRGSMHRAAFTNDLFRASYANDRLAFCVGCHAPHVASRDGDTFEAIATRAGADRGIDCVDCHRGGHGSNASIGTSSCASCHEFFQPNAREALQSTMTEHARSEFAGVSCADCHMGGRGGKDHRFLAGVRNVERMRAAITIAVDRTPGGVRVVLVTNGVGHAFPTGDLFRRLRLQIDALDDEGRIDDQTEILFGRTFAEQGGVRVNVEDRRVVDKRVEEHAVPFALGKNARYRLLYDRVLAERSGHAIIGDSTLLFEGTIR